MLVLSRKKQEKIFLQVGAMTITFVVVDIRGSQVRIGIEAPPEVQILREELLVRKKGKGPETDESKTS